MRKLFALLFLLALPGIAKAGMYKTIMNPFTGTLDYVTNIATGPSGGCVKYNGAGFVVIDCGSSPSFGVAAFSDAQSSTIRIGNGVWKAAGAITFSASYSNGPATSGAVSFSGWTGSLTLGNTYQGPTVSTAAVNYPSVGGTVVFTLNAAGALGSGSASITHSFNNDRYWGLATKNSGFTAGDVTSLSGGGTDLVNSIPTTFTVNAGSGQYITYAYPSRLGTATFTVGGFAGGFLGPYTVSITNASGYTENYYVYASVNSNLGNTTVTVTTP